jgi:hypothetical protein
MEQRSFDTLTRLMARAGARRELMRSLMVAAGYFVDVIHRQPAGAQTACPQGCADGELCLYGACARPCATDRDCRSKKKDDPCLLNSCVEGMCVEAIVDCLPGYECCERGQCCAKECASDADCAVVDPCRWGTCGADGLCFFTALDPCPICASDDDCAGNGLNTICCGGACQRPCPEGTAIGKGCECRGDGSASLDGLVVLDDASG